MVSAQEAGQIALTDARKFYHNIPEAPYSVSEDREGWWCVGFRVTDSAHREIWVRYTVRMDTGEILTKEPS